MTTDTRRAQAVFEWRDDAGHVAHAGEAEAVIHDEALIVGPVEVSFLDADVLTVGDYRIEIETWPGGRLLLTKLGRRFDTFVSELRLARNRTRVAGLLAHGITMPDVFPGAVLAGPRCPNGPGTPAEVQLFETHVTLVPERGDPWQIPFGAVESVRGEADPPSIVLAGPDGPTTLGRLARQRDACLVGIETRIAAQRELLEERTGHTVFSDGWGVDRTRLPDFDDLLLRFCSPERAAGAQLLLSLGVDSVRFGVVQLLDPSGETLACAEPLPEKWASFLLVSAGSLTALEILAGPSAATYVFRGEIEAVNRDLQSIHFRRAPLALTDEQAILGPTNAYRLALRRLAPLLRLRERTVARVVHDGRWEEAVRITFASSTGPSVT